MSVKDQARKFGGAAAKETEKLRQQSWQMGGTLVGLLLDLQPQAPPEPRGSRIKNAMRSLLEGAGLPCNYADGVTLYKCGQTHLTR